MRQSLHRGRAWFHPHDDARSSRDSSVLSPLVVARGAFSWPGRMPVSAHLLGLRRRGDCHPRASARIRPGPVAPVALPSIQQGRPGPGSARPNLPACLPRTFTIETSSLRFLAARSRQEVSFARISKSKSSSAGRRRSQRRWRRRHAIAPGFRPSGDRRLLRIPVLRQAQAARAAARNAEPDPAGSQANRSRSPNRRQRVDLPQQPARSEARHRPLRQTAAITAASRDPDDGREWRLSHRIYESRRPGAALDSEALFRHFRQAAGHGAGAGLAALRPSAFDFHLRSEPHDRTEPGPLSAHRDRQPHRSRGYQLPLCPGRRGRGEDVSLRIRLHHRGGSPGQAQRAAGARAVAVAGGPGRHGGISRPQRRSPGPDADAIAVCMVCGRQTGHREREQGQQRQHARRQLRVRGNRRSLLRGGIPARRAGARHGRHVCITPSTCSAIHRTPTATKSPPMCWAWPWATPAATRACGSMPGPSRWTSWRESTPLARTASPSGPTLEPLIQFGWLTVIAKPLFLALRFLYLHGIPNWGWDIILLTVLFNVLAAAHAA